MSPSTLKIITLIVLLCFVKSTVVDPLPAYIAVREVPATGKSVLTKNKLDLINKALQKINLENILLPEIDIASTDTKAETKINSFKVTQIDRALLKAAIRNANGSLHYVYTSDAPYLRISFQAIFAITNDDGTTGGSGVFNFYVELKNFLAYELIQDEGFQYNYQVYSSFTIDEIVFTFIDQANQKFEPVIQDAITKNSLEIYQDKLAVVIQQSIYQTFNFMSLYPLTLNYNKVDALTASLTLAADPTFEFVGNSNDAITHYYTGYFLEAKPSKDKKIDTFDGFKKDSTNTQIFVSKALLNDLAVKLSYNIVSNEIILTQDNISPYSKIQLTAVNLAKFIPGKK